MKAVLFDLDNTLYPETSSLFDQIIEKMNRYMADLLSVSPETAKTPEELGLPPQFRAIQGRMDKKGLFLEHDGRYYLSEERLKQMQKQSRK